MFDETCASKERTLSIKYGMPTIQGWEVDKASPQPDYAAQANAGTAVGLQPAID
jgi:hypothetical protein